MKTFILFTFFFLKTLLSIAQDLDWATSMGGTQSEYISKIRLDANRNIYGVGFFSGTVDFDPGPSIFNLTSAGGYDLFITKLDSSGNFQWAKQIGGTSSDQGTALALDINDNLIITGSFQDTVDFDPDAGTQFLVSSGTIDAFILKLDANGNFIFAKGFGGTAGERGLAIAADASGNIIAGGFFNNTVDFNPGAGVFNLTSFGASDIFVVKLDASGDFISAEQIGGTNDEIIYSLSLDVLGNVYACGYFKGTADFDPGAGSAILSSNGNQYDIFVMKLNPDGDLIWVKQMGGSGSDIGYALTLDDNGNVFSTGQFSGTADFDPGVGVYNLNSGGASDVFVSALDSSGNFLWARSFTGTITSAGYSITQDDLGNVYASGSFSGTVDFDPGVGSFNLTDISSGDAFIVKLDSFGNFLTALQMGGPSKAIGECVSIDHFGNIFVAGDFEGTADMDPGIGVYTLNSNGFTDIFIAKLKPFTVGLSNIQVKDRIQIYPNPFSSVLNIRVPEVWLDSRYMLSDQYGRVVEEGRFNGIDEKLDLYHLSNGVYSLTLTGATTVVYKVFKM